MTGHRIRIDGVIKDGKIVPRSKRPLDVSARIRQRTSKKVRVKRKGA